MTSNNLVNEYKQKVDNMVANLMYAKDNADKVYGSPELKNRYNAANFNEGVQINIYEREKERISREKLNNLRYMMAKERELGDQDLEIMKESNDKFDEDFNRNLEKINYIDKEIMTKDKLIIINEDESNSKERFVHLLQSIALYIFLMILPVLLLSFNIFSGGLALTIIIISGIITGVVATVRYYKEMDVNLVKKTKKTAKDFVVPYVIKMLPDNFLYKCPAQCQRKSRTPEEELLTPSYGRNVGNEVWLDNSMDKPIDGDIPAVGATKLGYLKLGSEAEPKPYFEGAPSSPKYVCRWNTDPKKMTSMNKGLEFTTSVPCNFYPGYETIRKF